MSRQDKVAFTKLFGQCFLADRLGNNKLIPVGGTSQFTDEVDIFFVGNFRYFENLYNEMHQSIHSYDTELLRNWLIEQQIEIDSKLVATLEAFTRKLQEKYPTNLEIHHNRSKLYARTTQPKLSTVFESRLHECGEIAALAQGYLEREGVDSFYFSGDVLWNRNQEFSEKHSFIVIQVDGRLIIFDPANPINTTGGYLPSIYTLDADFKAEVNKREKRFVTATNIITKENAFFGVNNGTNVSERNIV